MTSRRLLITGGSGYLGGELLRQAQAHGWHVAATYLTQRPTDTSATLVQLDITSPADVALCCAELHPDMIIHTAYRQHDPGLWAASADGAAHIARAARQIGARLIHISTDAIFDGAPAEPYTEDDAPCPITPYGRAKAAAEQQVATIDPTALIVRTSLLYGGTAPSLHEQLVIDAIEGRADVTFFTDEIRCPIQVTDLALALLELAPCQLGGVLNLAGADAVSRYDFARLIARRHGYDPAALRAGLTTTSPSPRPRACVLNSTKARSIMQTRLRGVYEVLA